MSRPKGSMTGKATVKPSIFKLNKEDKKNIEEAKSWNKYPYNLVKENPHLKNLLDIAKYKKRIIRYIEKNKKLRYNMIDIERLCGIKR